MYRSALQESGNILSPLDRSELFRYPKSYEKFVEFLNERIAAGTIPVSMLVIGVGHMEEPLSYLAAAKHVASSTGKTLEELITMDTVDVRPKHEMMPRFRLGRATRLGINVSMLSPEELANQIIMPVTPRRYPDSFPLSEDRKEHEAAPDIQAYIHAMTEDPQRSRFETPVELFEGEDRYDIISCNNVLQHMGSQEHYYSPFKHPNRPEKDYERYYAEVERILRMCKVGGICFLYTDNASRKGAASDAHLQKIPFYREHFEKTGTGMHRRVL